MKLMIELNCYEKLKNIAKTANDKIRKVKRLFYVSCAMIYISVIGMIYAICFDETILTIVFFILALLFSCGATKILCDPNAYFKRICNMAQKMLEVSDEKSCIQMECWAKTDDKFECYYFDKNGIMQETSIPYEKRYMRKKTTTFFICTSRTKRENHYDTSISINCYHCSPACAYSVCSIQTQTKQHQRTGSNY